MRPALRRSLVLALAVASGLVAASGRDAGAQAVAIDPTVVVIGPSGLKGGSLTLINTSPDPAEITIELRYGYATTDSLGRNVVRTDRPRPDAPDASAFVQVFPRKLILPPGQEQAVRFKAYPGGQIPPVEHWARVVVSVKGAAPVIAVPTNLPDSSGIRVGLKIETRTVLPLFYRPVAVTASLEVAHLDAVVVAGDSVRVSADLARTGTAAWIGVARLRVRDPKTGVVYGTAQRQHGIYETARPVWMVPLKPGTTLPSTAVVDLDLAPERPDLPPGALVPSQRVNQSVPVRAR